MTPEQIQEWKSLLAAWKITDEQAAGIRDFVQAQFDRVKELEAELAALRQQQGEPVAEIGWAAGVVVGITEVIGLTDSFYDLPVGTKLYREAAPNPMQTVEDRDGDV